MSHTTKPRWLYEVLDNNRLSCGSKVLVPERKTAAVLGYLALERATSRSRLAGLLWPDTEEATARNNLSQTLRRFRQLTEEPLIVAGNDLQLGDRLEVDAAKLRAASLSGSAAEVAVYRGELLSTFDYDDLPQFNEWLWSTREALNALYKEALETLVTTSEVQGDLGAALKYAERLVEADPVSEAGHRSVMRLHYLLGDRSAALKAYHRCKATLERELAVKPLPETVELAHLIEQGEVRGVVKPMQMCVLPPQVLRPPILVGREEAWEKLEEAWGRGQTIYVTGEPGVGKTRLVQEFVASKGRGLYLPARPGYQDVLFAGAAGLARTRIAEAPEVNLPPWVQRELSRILPEFRGEEPPPPLHGEEDKLRFFQAYLEMVKLTGVGFIATISDDTQYYDQATVELGGFMISQAPSLREGGSVPRYVIIYRYGELPLTSQTVVDRFVASEVAARIHLEPLNAKSTTSLLVSLDLRTLKDGITPQFSETIHRRTGGNALFILETLRNLIETDQLSELLPERLPLTHKVDTIVQQRLSRISPTAQRVVQAAAVLQSDFDLELLAEVLSSDPLELVAVWEELERAQIFNGDRFSHDLLSEAVAAAMSQQVGALLHRRSAKVLAERNGTPVRIAKHFLASGDDAKAAPYLLKAAQRAKDTLRLTEAAERYERAGDILERLGERVQAFEAYRSALRVRLEFDLGNDIEHALVKLRGAAKTPLMHAMVWRLATERHMRRGDYPETEAAAQRGLQELEGSDDVRARIELLTFLAAALARQGRADESAASLQQLLALAETVEGCTDGWLSVQLSHAASVLDDLSRSREALVYHRRALSLKSNTRERLVQLADYGFSLLSLGEARHALETLLEARVQLEGVTDVPVAECMILGYLGAAQHNLSRYTEALESFEAALRVTFTHKQDMQSKGAFVRRAKLWLTLGCFDEAAVDLAHALEEPQKPFSSGQVQIEITSGRLKVFKGRDASEHFEKAEHLLASGSPRLLAHLRIDQAAAPTAQGLDFAEEALALAKTLELPGLEIGARTRYAQKLLGLKRIPEALSHVCRAVELLSAYAPVDFYPGEVFLTHYQALAAAHDPQAYVRLGHCLMYIIRAADHHVPAAYRNNFLGKNPVNRAILEEAKRVGLQAGESPTEDGAI